MTKCWRMPAVAVAVLLCCGLGNAQAATPCANLTSLQLQNAQVLSATLLSGNVTGPDGNNYTGLPEFCSVAILATPSNDSLINILLWLPTNTWNGRFEGTGNGGYAGTMAIDAFAMVYGVKHGFAVAATDMGTAPSANNDADALIGHPEKWIDFGYRSTHLMTTLGKQVLQAMQGRAPNYSYFNGCSTGGQQALMSAQKYPADYDGILAGAAANNRTGVHTALLWTYAKSHETAKSYIPSDKVTLIGNAILAACVTQSGGVAGDQFLTDPRKCTWKPSALLCKGGSAGQCLSAAQVKTAQAIFDGPKDPVTKAQIYPGNPKGSETASSFGWNANQIGLGAEPNFDSLFKWVFGPTWTYNTFDFHDDMADLNEVLAGILNYTDPNLDAFRDRGGKLLMYHGWADPLAASQNSINYYTEVTKRADNGHFSPRAQIDTLAYARLFMAPGMNHCYGGPGANTFGNEYSGNIVINEPPTDDKNHHILLALVDWVENGNAPSRIVATKFVNDTPGQGIAFQRPLCPYPKIAKYNGAGNINLETSYTCALK